MVFVAFKPLSEHEFNTLSKSYTPIITGQGQGEINIFRRYRPVQNTRGHGLMSILGQIGRKALPFIKEYFLPSAKELGKNVLSDVIAGKSFKSSLKTRGKQSLKDVGQRIVKGSSSKRRMASLLKRKKRLAINRLRRHRRRKVKGKGIKRRRKTKNLKKNKKNKKNTARGQGRHKPNRSAKRRRKTKRRISRSKKSLMGKAKCSRRRSPSCPKDIFS